MTIAALGLLAIGFLQSDVRPCPGQMWVHTKEADIPMPLEKTTVTAKVAGFGAEVVVRQSFKNSSAVPIEAVYTFPLPHEAAVNGMRMQIGDRVIEGKIKGREEARQIYETAKNAGQSAALLDQERPNIFTQSVANVMPGKKIDIEIRYVQVLKYEEGQFEFVFPMVVGPRYTAPSTTDRNKIVPPAVAEGTRSGQTISLNVDIDAGAPIQGMQSVLQKVNVKHITESRIQVELAKADSIPNKDFVLRYRVATDAVQSAFLPQWEGQKGGFFTLLLMPPKAPTAQQIAPREFIFVMDQSGSQSGFPIEKSKELTLKIIKTLRPGDTFNVMGFSESVRQLWPAAKPLTGLNMEEASRFVTGLDANGGTRLRLGVEAALSAPADPSRLRLVVFNTDGYVGEEKEIIAAIHRYRGNARMFTFGIGNGVNRYLIDAMSEEGRGDSEVVTLGENADAAVDRFLRRTRTPVLTNISVTFSGGEITQTIPTALPDVFSEKPVVVFGRYTAPGKATATITGLVGGRPWSKSMDLDLSVKSDSPAITALWARKRVDTLERLRQTGGWYDNVSVTGESIKEVALAFGIMSSETSFVAVEQRVVNVGGKQRVVRVPVERVEGVGAQAYGESTVSFGKVVAAPMLRSSLRAGVGGGGGFGGPGGFPASAAVAGRSKGASNLDSISSDPSDNSLVIRDGVAVSVKTDPKAKIAKSLAGATGVIAIQIILVDLKPEQIKKLEELGFKMDDKDVSLKAVFGTAKADDLIKLAKLEFVVRISPI